METKKCIKCYEKCPKYFRLLPMTTNKCPDCGSEELEVMRIDMTPGGEE